MARWLVLLYRFPREPSGPRVAAWRALKRMEEGAYIQDGVFLLRATPLHRQSLEDLAHDIRNDGGEASVLEASDVDDEKHLISRLRAAREEP